MGYSVKNMGKAYEAGNYRTALNNAVHVIKEEAVLGVVQAAYEAVKAGSTYEEDVVKAGVKEVAIMLGYEVKAEDNTTNNTEEVTNMEENTKVEVEAEDVVTEEPNEENPWILVTGKRRSSNLYVTVFEGNIKEKLAELRAKGGYTFVCVSRPSAFNKFLTNNWKGGTEIVKNLNKKGIEDVEKFTKGIVQLAAEMGYVCETIKVDNTGKWALTIEAVEEDDDYEEEAA